MKRDWKKAGKLLIAEIARLLTLILGLYVIAVLPTQIPWEATLGLYLAGVVITHVWVFKGLSGNHSLTDFHAYAQDSGIFLVVFFWPAFVFFTFGPEDVSYKVKKKLGVLPSKEDPA